MDATLITLFFSLNLMAATEVFVMVRLVNKAFHYLVVYHESRKTYSQVFHILCLRRRFIALEKLPQSGSAEGQVNSLEGITGEIVEIYAMSRESPKASNLPCRSSNAV